MVLSAILGSGCRERALRGKDAPGAVVTPLTAGATSGHGDGGGEARAGSDANLQLEEMQGQYLNDTAAASPVNATWLGVHGWDDRLDDTSAAAQAREAARLGRTLERLEEIPALALDGRHQLDRTLLSSHARLALFELTEVQALEYNPVRYVALASGGVYELLAGEFDPLPERLRSIVGRLGRVRPLFEEARKNLRNPSEVHTRRAIELAQACRSFLAETLARVVIAVGDDRLIADFRTAQGDALRAFDDYLNFLQKDLLARSHGEYALGRERLARRLKLREAIELPPEALLAQLTAAADRELKSSQKRFEDAAQKVAPGKSPPEAVRLLDDDHPGAEQLLPAVQQTVDQVFAFARARALLPLPAETPRVQPMPPYLWGFALLDAVGPFEPRGGYSLFVDPVNPAWDPKARDEHLRAFGRAPMVLFAIHEPLAHVVQGEAVRRAPSTMQRLGVQGAFVEGFPRYLAQLLLDEGFGSNEPRLRLAQRREALLAVCRLVAALRVHTQGMRIEDAAKLFSDAVWMDDGTARREAERVAADPMLLDEGLGMLALLRLRDDAARERGAAFSLRELHEQVLAHGALPLGLLRQRLLRAEAGSLL